MNPRLIPAAFAVLLAAAAGCTAGEDAGNPPVTTLATATAETTVAATEPPAAVTEPPATEPAPPEEQPREDMTPSEAFCSDLEAGLTPMNIYAGLSDPPSPRDFADDAYGMAAISCPDQLKSNEPLRAFLTNWQINPDA